MRPILVPVLLVVAAACASSGGAGADPAAGSAPAAAPAGTPAPASATRRPPPAVQTTAPSVTSNRIETGSSALQMNTLGLDFDVKLFVTGTVDEAWAVLPGVYQELGIPLSLNDNVRKQLGNAGWRVRRTIARVPAQRYVECGSSGSMENAETYQLNLSIITSILPNPNGGSVVSTAISGTGKNIVTSSSAEVKCTSKGDLEIRIRDMVQKAMYAR
jgi:hypothetical protein